MSSAAGGATSIFLSFEAAATKLGWTGNDRGRRLKRACFAREQELHRRIVTRMGTSKRRHYRVTLGALRKAFPELFSSNVDTLRDRFSEYLSTIDQKISERVAIHVTEHVEPRLDELWERDEQIAGQVDALTQRVVALAQAQGRRP